ncbi:MAG TPA: hypothetical protein DEP23_06710 [Ruminococcaceae bacterium]|nr:hypothetical protein [Oscillospiraceae bacterium]
MEQSKYLPFDYLIGYCNNDVTYLKPNPESIASYIVTEGINGDITITTPLDTALITTFGMFINKCPNQEFLRYELLPIIGAMQQQERTPETPEEYTFELSEIEELGDWDGEDESLDL